MRRIPHGDEVPKSAASLLVMFLNWELSKCYLSVVFLVLHVGTLYKLDILFIICTSWGYKRKGAREECVLYLPQDHVMPWMIYLVLSVRLTIGSTVMWEYHVKKIKSLIRESQLQGCGKWPSWLKNVCIICPFIKLMVYHGLSCIFSFTGCSVMLSCQS